ncbi:hypothetical protein [Pannonibacter tanglangensis]|uniref:Uncharacterized protein n=1 Tax=Pannonibacter tanglangensis TaxID=2750084 RepID=A0ABW9ZH04_9HYPH|nr:hypothetical protein [Pannonibacter sp. XCT-34]NBN64130.1 hypothetical protein [Pannonibacter sp. XCT-34]
MTNQFSAQLAMTRAMPRERIRPTEYQGRIRVAYFNFTQSGQGPANATAQLIHLPEGRVRILRHLSMVSTSAFGAGRTLNVGFAAYRNLIGDAVAANETALIAARDVAAAASAAPSAAAGADPTLYLESRDGVDVYARVLGNTIPDGAKIWGMLAYVTD